MQKKTSKYPNNNHRWSSADEAELLRLADAGVPTEELMQRFGRSEKSICIRLIKLRTPFNASNHIAAVKEIRKYYSDRHLYDSAQESISHLHTFRSTTWDYKGRGIYMVTFVVKDRRPLLGSLVDDAGDPHIFNSPIGHIVEYCWKSIPRIQAELAHKKSLQTGTLITRNIVLLAHQVMPDHFHGVLFVKEPMDVPLGEVLHGFMMGCTMALRNADDVLFRRYIDRAKLSFDGTGLFDPGYHDRILFHKGQLANMIHYVHDNPRRLYIKRHHPGFFHVYRDVSLLERTWSAVGNLLLLDAELKQPVHVRRRFTEAQCRDYMNGCILAARKGAVFVSPFVSEKEKAVLKEALKEKLPVIIIADSGLPDLYKPAGDLFEACAEGRLLLLSPWEYNPIKPPLTRELCVTMNTLAEALCSNNSASQSGWLAGD